MSMVIGSEMELDLYLNIIIIITLLLLLPIKAFYIYTVYNPKIGLTTSVVDRQ